MEIDGRSKKKKGGGLLNGYRVWQVNERDEVTQMCNAGEGSGTKW